MSRFVEWGGKHWGRNFFDPPANAPRGVCVRCGGLGVVPETIDEERYDVAVPCPSCRFYCKPCGRWVKRNGHQCREAKP